MADAPNEPKVDARKDEKVEIAQVISMFRDSGTFSISCMDVIDHSSHAEMCKQTAFRSKCDGVCKMAPYELKRKLSARQDPPQSPDDAEPGPRPPTQATDPPTQPRSAQTRVMRQYIGDRDYEVDFAHASMLRATITELGVSMRQCEDACISDPFCTIATYDTALQRCVCKSQHTADASDTAVTFTEINRGTVYPDFRPNVVSFEKVPGNATAESARRSSEIRTRVADAEAQRATRIFEADWVHKPNSSVLNVLYSWPDMHSGTDKDPPDAHLIIACARRCDDTADCSSFVIQHGATTPNANANANESKCGLILQPYGPDAVVSSLNVSTYERVKSATGHLLRTP